jgi:hypothetical protein
MVTRLTVVCVQVVAEPEHSRSRKRLDDAHEHATLTGDARYVPAIVSDDIGAKETSPPGIIIKLVPTSLLELENTALAEGLQFAIPLSHPTIHGHRGA